MQSGTKSSQAAHAAAPQASPAGGRGGALRRKCACGKNTAGGGACGACDREKARLQRRAAGTLQEAERIPDSVHEVLSSTGRPLDSSTRSFFESRFGHDFSGVRVHTDAKAAESAAAVGSVAYTVSDDVVFGAGRYLPETDAGRLLLAHELTHVLQQRGGPTAMQGKLTIGPAEDDAEREADRVANHVLSSAAVAPVKLPAARASSLQRKKGGCKSGKWEYDYDGCSVPDELIVSLADQGIYINKDNPAGGKDTHFAKKISSAEGGRACDRHDECYQTCHHVGGIRDYFKAKAKCDERMRDDMVATCVKKSEDASTLKRCLYVAGVYYAGLVGFAYNAFTERQVEVCACMAQSSRKAAPGKGSGGPGTEPAEESVPDAPEQNAAPDTTKTKPDKPVTKLKRPILT